MLDELLIVLTKFGGGGPDAGNDVVRFVLPSIFWSVLIVISAKQWGRTHEKRDLYVGIAAALGLCRELSMLIMQYGSSRGFMTHQIVFRYYPPFEHAFTMMSGLLLGYAFMKYFLPWRRFSYIFFLTGSALIAILYLITASLWPSYLDSHPDSLFGAFWGDMAFRCTASVLMGTVIGFLAFGKRRGLPIPAALLIAFLFLFLDEFLMIFNLATRERHISIYAPIRHNLHIWAIPLFVNVYWTDLHKRLLVLEQHLRQSLKMEAIGTLAGGVAHDFNNILSIVLGYSQILLRKIPPGDPTREKVEIIEDAGRRAEKLTRQLLAFSRKQVLSMSPVNISAIVEDTTKMLRRMVREDIVLEYHTAKMTKSAMADVGQIEQVLMNLVVNARDAMPNGGRLIIETAEVNLDRPFEDSRKEVGSGEYVLILVSDTGVGMSREVRERMFEPFFTTKEMGKGTGLGLSIVFGIVKQHNGHIHVYSEPGKGTTFRIYLPCCVEKATSVEAKEADSLGAGNATILVVDDDHAVRRLIVDTLSPMGYRILEAGDGKEALKTSNAFDGRIDLLLTDVVMPHMNGRELAETLRTRRSDLKIVYMSGYTNDTVLHQGVLDERLLFLQKPLRIAELAKTLSGALAGEMT